MLRIILIILGVVLLFRLLSSLFRITDKKPRRSVPGTKPGGEVGEGWKLDEKKDDENIESKGA